MKEDYRRTFVASKHGARVLRDILAFCCLLENHTDVRAEGRRDVGLRLLEFLDKRTYDGLLELSKVEEVNLIDGLED